MKLYSQSQLVVRSLICIAISGLVAGAVAGILAVNLTKKKAAEQKNTANDVELSEVVPDNAAIDNVLEEESVFVPEYKVTEDSYITSGDYKYTLDEYQNITVYENCNEAVVNINTKVMAYDWFLEPVVQDGGSGSGVIIDPRGYILTNVHVIQNATQILVSLYNGTQYEAVVVGQDMDSDLAVIKFKVPEDMKLKTISFGDSAVLKVGQKVIAIGNPFGMERTITTGIVSALGRPIYNSNNRIIRNMIQTDTAINPGNSGGPLLDTNGRMVGINTMIMSSSGSSSGVGFAVPAETAKRVSDDLIQYGKVQRGTMAVTLVPNSYRIAQYAKLDIATGMIVSEVKKGGNAEAAGIQGGSEGVYYGSSRNIIYLGGDVITKIGDVVVNNIADYYSAMENKKPGDVVPVVVRRDRKDLILNVTLGE